jgi:hypothetical protein
VRLVLVGDGAEPALVARAAAEGLPVSFLDPLPKPHLAGLLAGADIGLLCLAPVPEFAEWTAPNKLAEGLASGLPMVRTCPAAPPGCWPGMAAASRCRPATRMRWRRRCWRCGGPAAAGRHGARARIVAERRFDSRGSPHGWSRWWRRWPATFRAGRAGGNARRMRDGSRG